MTDIFQKLIVAGITAPSGENCQPWEFKQAGDSLLLFNLPERDTSVYNFQQKGSLVSHGAVIENMSIAASQLGHVLEVELFPDPQQPNLVARLNVKQDSVSADPLNSAIKQRSTNRKPYKPVPLTTAQQAALEQAVGHVFGAELKILTDRESITAVAPALTLNEQLIFSNKHIHQFFFSHLRWTEQEDQQKKNGFFVKALELTPGQVNAFKLFRHWPLISFLGKFGFAKVAGQANLKTYASSGALAVITMPGNSSEDYVNAGRATERLWLSATSLGLSAQPVTGTLFFMQKVLSGQHQEFSAEQITMIKQSYEKIRQAFGIEGRTISMLLRLGEAPPPTARSSRFEPQSFTS